MTESSSNSWLMVPFCTSSGSSRPKVPYSPPKASPGMLISLPARKVAGDTVDQQVLAGAALQHSAYGGIPLKIPGISRQLHKPTHTAADRSQRPPQSVIVAPWKLSSPLSMPLMVSELAEPQVPLTML